MKEAWPDHVALAPVAVAEHLGCTIHTLLGLQSSPVPLYASRVFDPVSEKHASWEALPQIQEPTHPFPFCHFYFFHPLFIVHVQIS